MYMYVYIHMHICICIYQSICSMIYTSIQGEVDTLGRPHGVGKFMWLVCVRVYVHVWLSVHVCDAYTTWILPFGLCAWVSLSLSLCLSLTLSFSLYLSLSLSLACIVVRVPSFPFLFCLSPSLSLTLEHTHTQRHKDTNTHSPLTVLSVSLLFVALFLSFLRANLGVWMCACLRFCVFAFLRMFACACVWV